MFLNVLASFLATCFVMAEGADPPAIDMLFKPRNLRSLNDRQIVGVNSFLIRTNIRYDHPKLQPWLNERGVQAIRWPGGTPSNYFDWRTGRALLPIGFNGASSSQQTNISKRVNDLSRALNNSRQDRAAPVSEIRAFSRWAGVVNIVVNVCGTSPVQTRRLAAKVKQFGIMNPYFELGNELYFSTYDFCVNSGRKYIDVAKPHALAIRSELRKAKIAAVVSSAVFSEEDFLGAAATKDKKTLKWNGQLATDQKWFDAVTVHMYGSLGVSDPRGVQFETLYKSAIGHADNNTEAALDILRRQFARKDIWITEWHVGGFSAKFEGLVLRDTWLGGLYATQVFLKFLTDPSVKLTSLHSLTKMIFIPQKPRGRNIAENYLDDDIETVPSNGMPVRVIGEIVKRCNSVARIAFRGASRYAVRGEYAGRYSEVAGVIFKCGSSSMRAVVVNKLDREYRLGKVSVDRFGSQEMAFASGEVYSPQGLRSDQIVKLDIPRGQLAGGVTLPPYSIAVFRLAK